VQDRHQSWLNQHGQLVRRMRDRLTYANVMSTLAVFIALGGSSYAAVRISGANIRNHSIGARKLKPNSVTGQQVRESRLGRVPRAAVADRLGTFTPQDLLQRCPSDTFAVADVCVERTPRPATPYGSAVIECENAGGFDTPGRRLPTHNELSAALHAVTLASGGELTSDVYPSATDPGRIDDLVIVDQVGGVALVPDRIPEGSRQYRCVTDPMN
jgi:hypothetical protein